MDNIENKTGIEELATLLTTFFEEGTRSAVEFLESDLVQDVKEVVGEVGLALENTIKTLKILKSVASIPTKLYLHKFERFCREIPDIPLEKRQKFMEKLGHERFQRESVFILNVINRIEEEDKLPLLAKILDACTEGVIPLAEFRRLTMLIDRTLYNDLEYLGQHITADPVVLRTDSDYGLVASGLLVTAGNEVIADFGSDDDPSDTGIRFNYTTAAKKLASILYGTTCNMTPTNKGVSSLKFVQEELP